MGTAGDPPDPSVAKHNSERADVLRSGSVEEVIDVFLSYGKILIISFTKKSGKKAWYVELAKSWQSWTRHTMVSSASLSNS